MKLRSSLLVACMVIVPALAMFSHHIPVELRNGIRRHATTLVAVCLGRAAEAGPLATANVVAGTSGPQPHVGALPTSVPADARIPKADDTAAAGLSTPPLPTRSPPTPAQAPLPTAAATGDAPDRPGSTAPTGGTPSTEAENAATPALVAQLADRTRQARDQQARDLQAIGTQLAALGAVAFTCQPLPGPDGLFTCDCRVPVDPTGQLQRVFQASGRDPTSASLTLVQQVTAFHERTNQRAGANAGAPAAALVAPPRAAGQPVPEARETPAPNDTPR